MAKLQLLRLYLLHCWLFFLPLCLFVFTNYSLLLSSAAQWYFKSRLIKSFGLRDFYVCIFALRTSFFFSINFHDCRSLVYASGADTELKMWKQKWEKNFVVIFSLSHTQQRWTMLLTLWRALESLITQLRKHNTENLRWRSFGFGIQVSFSSSLYAFF